MFTIKTKLQVENKYNLKFPLKLLETQISYQLSNKRRPRQEVQHWFMTVFTLYIRMINLCKMLWINVWDYILS